MVNKYNPSSVYWVMLGAIVIGLLVYSCANKGFPEGGAKDVTPPKVTLEQPASFTKNFNKKNINIYFNEYVVLKNATEKFIISPPQTKKPKVRERGKYVMVEFVDSLRPDMTYSLDFADAIVDNNEGNPLGYYRYVFSTGNYIDTMELSGNVVNAITNEPMLNTSVFLYETHSDSVPILKIPDYMGRTDSAGFFRVTNIKPADYKIIALEDNSRDYKFTPEAEPIAFLDTLVRPVIFEMTRRDTIHNDSLKTDSITVTDYLAYGPNNLYLRLFQEEQTQLYLADESRKERERLDFTFSIPYPNEFKIELMDDQTAEGWYLPEISSGRDSITLWMTDSLVYKRDSLRFKLSYLRSDSTRNYVVFADTVKLDFMDKKVSEKSKKKEASRPKAEFIKMTIHVATEQDVNKSIPISFERPVHREGLDSIRLLEKVDTVFNSVAYILRQDPIKPRQYYLEATWKPETEYVLKIDSAVISDIYGRHNNKEEKKFRVKSLESYGKIILTVEGAEEVGGQLLLQLYKPENTKKEEGKTTFVILQEKVTDKDGEVTFEFLSEGKYKVRAVLDKNRNGKWDTGLYLKHIQPEEIKYLPTEINVKQNFDVEQEFKLIQK